MLRMYDKQQPDYIPGLSSAEKKVRLAKMSYQDFLLNVAKVDPQVLWFFRHFGEGVFCVGADATPALFAWQMGQPGFSGLRLDPTPEGVLSELPGVQHGRQKEGGGAAVHFPDGNATIARLLVRWLIPDAAPGKTHGRYRRRARELRSAGPLESAGAHSPEQHRAQRATRR